MQGAKRYVNYATDRIENALNQMPPTKGVSKSLSSSTGEITRYVEQLIISYDQDANGKASD